MLAQAVEGADRGLGVRHPDVHVQTGDGRHRGVAQEVADLLIAGLVGDLGAALERARMGAGAQQAGPACAGGAAHVGERGDRLAGGRAHLRDELDLAGVKLLLECSRAVGGVFQHRLRGIDLRPRHRIDEEELLLDAERERAAGAEVRIAARGGFSAQASERWSVSPSALSSSSCGANGGLDV